MSAFESTVSGAFVGLAMGQYLNAEYDAHLKDLWAAAATRGLLGALQCRWRMPRFSDLVVMCQMNYGEGNSCMMKVHSHMIMMINMELMVRRAVMSLQSMVHTCSIAMTFP